MGSGDDDEVFMTSSLNVTPETTEQHSIVRSGKSEAEITTIKDGARCVTLLKPTTDGHKAARGFSATAELLVSKCFQLVKNNRELLPQIQQLLLITAFGSLLGAGNWLLINFHVDMSLFRFHANLLAIDVLILEINDWNGLYCCMLRSILTSVDWSSQRGPLTSRWPHLRCDVDLEEGRGILTEQSPCYSIVYFNFCVC